MFRPEELVRLPEEVWAYMELREDPVFAHIDPGRYSYYVRQGIRAGRECAAGWSVEQIREELQKEGVMIRYLEEEPLFAVHSQIIAEKQKYRIDIYLPVLREILPLIERYEQGIVMEDLKALHLAHEFYHYLEYETGVYVSETSDKVPCRSFGFFKREAAVVRLREIAAHSFAKQLCGFGWGPQFLDFLLWAEKDEKFAAQYAERCMEAYGNLKEKCGYE